MLRRLLPRETSFFDFFERHAALTVEGTHEFQVLASTGSNIIAQAKRIKEVEHEADVVTHQCVEALHKTFITPIDRDDIHRLITRMDDILDEVEEAADRLTLYEISAMTPDLKSLADVLVRAVAAVEQAVGGLRHMNNAEAINAKCIEVRRLEGEGDAVMRSVVARLFREEKDPIAVIKWKEIYQNLENATDRCEDVANIIEGIVLENA